MDTTAAPSLRPSPTESVIDLSLLPYELRQRELYRAGVRGAVFAAPPADWDWTSSRGQYRHVDGEGRELLFFFDEGRRLLHYASASGAIVSEDDLGARPRFEPARRRYR